MIDPLYSHFLDIVADPASDHLILAGGFGIRLKREYIRDVLIPIGERTVIAEIPDVRPTLDLDFFLKLEVFIAKEEGTAIRTMLDRLGYEPKEPNMQFSKPLGLLYPDQVVKVDLLSRLPESDEMVRVKDPRVGEGDLHGRKAPEAFAVEDSPVRLPIKNIVPERFVNVPHPYAWINMKTAAAWDWHHMKKAQSERHAFDDYLLVAMLTERELSECVGLRGKYSDHSEVDRIQQMMPELFGTRDAPGFLEARRQAGNDLDFDLFWQAYQEAIGPA